jgi:TolA-binding protein
MAFELLSDNETARMIYKKIVNHYSSSPEAKVAKEKLGKL